MSKKSKNKKIKVGYVILCLSLVIIVLLLVYFIIFKINDNKKLPQGPIIAEEKPETYTLSLAMVGDTLIHDEIYDEAHKNANYQGYDFKPMFSLIKKYIEDNNYDLAYYNQETANEIDILLKPLIVHGLIAALQMFEDGNTRLGRVIQSIELWHLSNQFLETKLPQPALYMSRSYYPFREQYREKITNIVVENNQEGWNNWLHFNLNRIEDQIQFNEYNLEQYRTRLNYEHAKKR